MRFLTPFLLSSLLLTLVHGADLPATERFSVATGKLIEKDESTKGQAVMTIHHPDHPNGTAIVIYPGGGYRGLVVDGEGQRIAKWFGEHGVTGVVVEYRLPNGDSSLPLADAKRATRIVRLHAADWKLDPKRIGNIGFSAGGHLASTAATHFDKGAPSASDPIEKESSRPDFSILVYPVITMGVSTHGGSRTALLGKSPDETAVDLFSSEKQVTADTPPTYLAHAQDDKLVPPANSEMYYQALLRNHVPAEYLKLPSGGHGLNGYKGPMWEAWKTGSLKWLTKQGFLPPANAN
jgi:acetyl esterase/lipase